MLIIIIYILNSAFAAAAVTSDARVLVASSLAQVTLVEVESPRTLSFRVCRGFPAYPSELAACAVIAANLPNRPEVHDALERAFREELDEANARTARAHTPLGTLERAFLWGVAGSIASAGAERLWRGPGHGFTVGPMLVSFLGYGGGVLIVDHLLAGRRRQDQTLSRRLREMTESEEPNRLTSPGDRARARRDMTLVTSALRRAVTRVKRSLPVELENPTS